MRKRVICEKCRSLIEYDDKVVWLGNREHEDVNCPNCQNVVASVFTDLIPAVYLVEKGEVYD